MSVVTLEFIASQTGGETNQNKHAVLKHNVFPHFLTNELVSSK